jgi:glycosidase
MKETSASAVYFPHGVQISARSWRSHDLGTLSQLIAERRIPPIIFHRQLALRLNRRRSHGRLPVHAGQLNLFAVMQTIFRYLIDVTAEQEAPGVLENALRHGGMDPAGEPVRRTATAFVELFPPPDVLAGGSTAEAWLNPATGRGGRRRIVLRELLLLRLAAANPAIDSFREILDDAPLLAVDASYTQLVTTMTTALSQGPRLAGFDLTLPEILLAPVKASPDSLSGQVEYIREQWGELLPLDLLESLTGAWDVLQEEERERGWGGGEPGPSRVLEFGRRPPAASGGFGPGGDSVLAGYDYPEYERFSRDEDWMSNVVMVAKMVYVWLDQLGRQYGHPITTLDQVPDAELDRLAHAGFSALWLIGVWERSPASQRIKQICGNPEALASAYSLYDYEIAADLGGWEALANLRQRALMRGIRLASDMVPNHTGIFSRWVVEHPDWFIQSDYPPFPGYSFNGEDLSRSGEVCIQIEDGYWTKSDAAVVFRLVERNSGRIRYIYHGNDGTSFPWNDTAQLNYLLPQVREAVIQTILHVARNFPIIRFDAAMTLAKKHFQRLWFPIRGLGGGIPSRAEHGMTREEFDAVFPVEFWREVVDRVASEAPGTLLLAEAFWLMEGYFVRTLGMHRVYNSAFMNMLKKEENAKYRQTIRNVLEFNPGVLKRFVNFMNNPDEKTAVEQFGSQGKYFGACVMMVTMPGLPMFGHGQIEGFREKYGMEYRRAYWDEVVDQGLVQGHRMWIFPLLHRRALFSGSENFVLYDFHGEGGVDENVFAYSNRSGDQRALVLYHNRHAATTGWIRESVPFNVTDGGDQPLLRCTTLADSLGFNPGEGVYYAFRDAADGREFLRRGRELATRGLYAELGEYEFHLFMDFREIHDDADRSWEGLHHALDGRGVADLDVERLQVRFASLNASFALLLENIPLPGIVGAAEGTPGADAFADSLGDFLAILEKELAVDGKAPAVTAAQVVQELSLLAGVLAMKPVSGDARQFYDLMAGRLGSLTGFRLLLTWLLLRGLPATILDGFGLDHTLRRHLTLDGGDHGETGAGDPLQLLRALLDHGAGSGGLGWLRRSTEVERLFSIVACRRFLLVHESGGVVWFNKERIEELVTWLFIVGLSEAVKGSPAGRTVSGWLGAAGRELRRLSALAARTGYRVPLFLSSCAGSAVAPRGAGRKTGGRRST